MLPQNLGQEIKKTNKQIASQGLSLISSALILVAGLAWNDLIKDAIAYYFNTGSGLISRLIYALIVTAIAAIIATRLSNIQEKLVEKENQNG